MDRMRELNAFVNNKKSQYKKKKDTCC